MFPLMSDLFRNPNVFSCEWFCLVATLISLIAFSLPDDDCTVSRNELYPTILFFHVPLNFWILNKFSICFIFHFLTRFTRSVFDYTLLQVCAFHFIEFYSHLFKVRSNLRFLTCPTLRDPSVINDYHSTDSEINFKKMTFSCFFMPFHKLFNASIIRFSHFPRVSFCRHRQKFVYE